MLSVRVAGVVDHAAVARDPEIYANPIVRAVVVLQRVVARKAEIYANEIVRASVAIQCAVHAVGQRDCLITCSAVMDVAVPDDEIGGSTVYVDPVCERCVYVPSTNDVWIGNYPAAPNDAARVRELGVVAYGNYTMRSI